MVAASTYIWQLAALFCAFIAVTVQGLPIAPVAGASLAPEAFTIKSAYELFKDGDFDLGGKQVTFNPAPLPTGGFILSADGSAELIDLDEDWETADGILNITIDAGFPFAGELKQELYIHPSGYVAFDAIDFKLDCTRASTFSNVDIIAAFCSPDLLPLVQYALLDDRIVVQWALPDGQCTTNGTAPTPSIRGPLLRAQDLLRMQLELEFSGLIRLGWEAGVECQAAVGVGAKGSSPQLVQFSSLVGPTSMPPATEVTNCSLFTGSGPASAYSCAIRKLALLPSSLPTVVLFAEAQLLEQQVLTIVNVAGQGIALTSNPAQAPAPSPIVSPAPSQQAIFGGRRLKQAASQIALAPLGSEITAPPSLARAPTLAAIAPLSVEDSSSTVSAVGIVETSAAASSLEFVPAPACTQPKQAGPCTNYSTRWRFDGEQCQEFVFGGCLGNLNNFASELSCQQACIAGTIAPSAAASPAAVVSNPGPDKLVFLATSLVPEPWITLDATSGVLPAGAVAALHLTYNATGLSPGTYQQNITINSNDLKTPQTRLKVNMHVFCKRLNSTRTVPKAPSVDIVSLSGKQPDWADAADLMEDILYVFFEVDVIADSPVAALLPANIVIEAEEEGGVVLGIEELSADVGYGPMCAAWRVRGAAPLPADYETSTDGALLLVTVAGLRDSWAQAVPPVEANRTLFQALPQCTFYAQAMAFGGDFGLVVNSAAASARAVLVCSVPLFGLCQTCIHAEHSPSAGDAAVSFLGLAPNTEAQYDVEVSWLPGSFFGGINLTLACNATDDLGRPLSAVQPLRFAVVAQAQLTPPLALALPPAEPHYPPGLEPEPLGQAPNPLPVVIGGVSPASDKAPS